MAKTDPGPPKAGNGLDTIDATVGVPQSLSDALDALEAVTTRWWRPLDATWWPNTGGQAHRVGSLHSATTDWEIREYLPFL